ncbi:MAG: hypothetical protein ACOCQT_01810, partial [Desulfovermiculus sp.]
EYFFLVQSWRLLSSAQGQNVIRCKMDICCVVSDQTTDDSPYTLAYQLTIDRTKDSKKMALSFYQLFLLDLVTAPSIYNCNQRI